MKESSASTSRGERGLNWAATDSDTTVFLPASYSAVDEYPTGRPFTLMAETSHLIGGDSSFLSERCTDSKKPLATRLKELE